MVSLKPDASNLPKELTNVIDEVGLTSYFFVDRDNKIRSFYITKPPQESKNNFIVKLASFINPDYNNDARLVNGKQIYFVKPRDFHIPTINYFDLIMGHYFASATDNKNTSLGSDLKNKICFVGMDTENSHQIFSLLSVSSLSLADGNFLVRFSKLTNILIVTLVFILSLILFLRISSFKRVLLGLVISLFLIIFNYFSFAYLGRWFDLLILLVAVFLSELDVFFYRCEIEKSERRKIQELKLAHLLKERQLMPAALDAVDGLKIGVTRYKSGKVHGDFFQFLQLSDTRFGILIGYAPGEGLDTVNYLIKSVNEWRANAHLYQGTNRVFQIINNTLFTEANRGFYLTAIYLIIDVEKMTITYSNAGHDPIIFIPNQVEKVRIIESEDPTPLGIARNISFDERMFQITKNDLIIIYTGGLWLLKNQYGQKFDPQKLAELVIKQKDFEPAHIVDNLFKEVIRFAHGSHLDSWSLLTIGI
jgi:hypothetical protein